MLLFQYSLYVALFSTFGIAIANLGITGYLLALVRDPNTARRQYYVLVNPVLRVLSPMSILPGWILEESSWFTLATSMITIADVPIIGFILWRRQRLGSNDRSDKRYFAWLAICCLVTINLIMSSSALAWTARENHGYHDLDPTTEGFDINAPTFGPYYRYTSSVGFTLASFSCSLAEVAVGEDTYAHHLCHIARTPCKFLIAQTALSGAVLLLAIGLWKFPSVDSIIDGPEKASGETKAIGITCEETEMGSNLATARRVSGTCRRTD
ncbi:hypothetical protein D6D05_09707 [Aureobasidium pullulans]|nr:hypothetical protein D6D05_09707 [Aureobasidium pullulans]